MQKSSEVTATDADDAITHYPVFTQLSIPCRLPEVICAMVSLLNAWTENKKGSRQGRMRFRFDLRSSDMIITDKLLLWQRELANCKEHSNAIAILPEYCFNEKNVRSTGK